MRTIITVLAVCAAGLGLYTAPATATPTTTTCVTVRDTVTKTDSGHGTPAAWADLVLHRTTKVCTTGTGYTVDLTDTGTLWTRTGAGSPNGTGTQITRRVPGTVHGTYHLTVTGGHLAHRHGDVTASSTEYVKSLFTGDAQVSGGPYSWTYTTRCERWVDSSANSDGQGTAAGNITGKTCRTHPAPPVKVTPRPKPTGTPSSVPSTPATGGEAAPATPVTGTPHFTG